MDYPILEKSPVFKGMSSSELHIVLEKTPHNIRNYNKDEVVFHMMQSTSFLGIILSGRVEAQKTFPNGSQINVSIVEPGELVGAAAVFSKSQKYPCDIVALEPVSIMMFRKKDILTMMQENVTILENFATEISSATYMLQQKLELMSYNGIAQKAAFWLLMHARQTGDKQVQVPGSISRWALMMNVSRTSLHRELKKLESEGLISYTPSTIKILDEASLIDVLGK